MNIKRKQVAGIETGKVPGPRTLIMFSILMIICSGMGVYANSLCGEFVWDDDLLVKHNRYIRQTSYIPGMFTQDIGAGAGEEYDFYRPLQMVTYVMDYSMWKLNPAGYRLTSVLLHIAAALSVYWLTGIIFKDNLCSLITGILFVVHPVHTEAVAYISGRADPLALLFMTLALIFYIKYFFSSKIFYTAGIVICYAAALLSRETALILPVLAAAYHYYFDKTNRWWKILWIVLPAVIYIGLRLSALSGLTPDSFFTTTLAQRAPGFFAAFAQYVKLLFLPFPLHMEYGIIFHSWTGWKTLAGMILFGVGVLVALKVRHRHPEAGFLMAWFFITLLPVSNLYPINAYMAEHWLYAPSVGFCGMTAMGLTRLWRGSPKRWAPAVLILSLVGFYSALTVRQNIYWKDPKTLLERTIKHSPGSFKAYYNLANIYKSEKDIQKAVYFYQKAIQMKQDFSDPYNNLGTISADMGKIQEAINLYKKAVEIKADNAQAYNNLGNAYAKINQNTEALAAYEQAINVWPEFAEAYNNLGILQKKLGRDTQAVDAYLKAVQFDPSYSSAYYNLGNLYRKLNDYEKSAGAYKKSIETNPNFVEAYNNLAVLYSKAGKNKEAVDLFFEIIRRDPEYSSAYHNIAVIYFQEKKYDLAIEYCDKARQLDYVDEALFESLKPYRH